MEVLIAIISVIAALIAAVFFGRKSGADSVEREHKTEVIDAVKQAKQVQDSVASLNSDDRRDRLRKLSK
jgi:uncharacterized protein involved in cysteine biosynthesis